MEDEKLIHIDEMAEILGVTINAFRMKMFKDPNIPKYKIGGSLRFKKSEVLEYFRQPKVEMAVSNDKA